MLVAQSCPTLETPGTVAHQAPLPMEFSRQEYWNGLPCPPLGDLPNPGTEPGSPELQVDSLPAELPEKPWSTAYYYTILLISMSSIVTMGKVKFREIKKLAQSHIVNKYRVRIHWSLVILVPGSKLLTTILFCLCFCYKYQKHNSKLKFKFYSPHKTITNKDFIVISSPPTLLPSFSLSLCFGFCLCKTDENNKCITQGRR